MQDPMVIFVFRAAIASGLFSVVVRYNMRGAGASTAKRMSFNPLALLSAPEADPQDLVAVCQHVLAQRDSPVGELHLVGYSYGATVAASALAQLPQVRSYVGIGFPLGSIANLVLRSRAHWSELEASPVPKLLVAGTRDSHCPLSTLRSLVAQFAEQQEDAAACGQALAAGPLELQTIDGADHFFAGAWELCADIIMRWLQRQTDAQTTGTA